MSISYTTILQVCVIALSISQWSHQLTSSFVCYRLLFQKCAMLSGVKATIESRAFRIYDFEVWSWSYLFDQRALIKLLGMSILVENKLKYVPRYLWSWTHIESVVGNIIRIVCKRRYVAFIAICRSLYDIYNVYLFLKIIFFFALFLPPLFTQSVLCSNGKQICRW